MAQVTSSLQPFVDYCAEFRSVSYPQSMLTTETITNVVGYTKAGSISWSAAVVTITDVQWQKLSTPPGDSGSSTPSSISVLLACNKSLNLQTHPLPKLVDGSPALS